MADTTQYKNSVWDVALVANSMQYRDRDTTITGNGAILQLGRGALFENWRFGATLDVFLGPYTEILEEQVKTDFFGTGLSAYSNYAFGQTPFKSGSGIFGLVFSVSYADIIGRSIANRDTKNNSVISNLSARMSLFTGQVGFFYASLKRPRIVGNSPELLQTRIEGYTVQLNAGLPIQSSYRIRYTETFAATDETEESTTDQVKRGKLKGYAIQFVVAILLGH